MMPPFHIGDVGTAKDVEYAVVIKKTVAERLFLLKQKSDCTNDAKLVLKKKCLKFEEFHTKHF